MMEVFAVARKIILLIAALYIAVTAIAFLMQERMMFFMPGIENERIRQIRQKHPEAEEVSVKTHDSITLRGWLLHRNKAGPSPLLIYFGGNAEEVSWMMEQKEVFTNWSMLLINYRGYGHSEGKPGEKALLNDALLLYDTFSKKEEIDPERIAVMGRSLGCAMAIHLSANRNIAGTVLISPFESMVNVSREHFPFLPTGLLMKHKFKMLPDASSAGNPMLTMVASDDEIIPPGHSKKLFDAWKGDKGMEIIKNAGHNDISVYPEFWEVISSFLNRLI